MAIRFTKANANEYITAGDSASATFPNSDWTLAFFFNPVGDQTDSIGHYVFSNDTLGSSNQINIYYNGSAAGSNQNKININVAATSVISTGTSGTHTSGWRLYVLQRSGTSVVLRTCPILSTAPTDGSAVSSENTARTLSAALDGSGLVIGARVDFNTARLSDDAVTRVFRYDGTLTDLEVARLAYGEQITDLGKTPAWYVKFVDNTDYTDQQSLLTFTKNGSPTTQTEPSWGYSPSTDLLSITDLTNHRIYQRSGTSGTVSFSGAYTSTAPNSVEVQIYASNGTTVVQAWTALSSATISGGTWSGSLSVPAGGMYRFAARSKDSGGTVLFTTAVSTNTWGMGDILALIGSSGAVKWADSSSGTGFTANTNIRTFNSSDAWAAAGTDGAIITVCNAFNNYTGYPVGYIQAGVSGTELANWSNSGHSNYTQFVTDINAVGGKLAAVLSHVGTNDAANGTVASKAGHLSNYRTLISNIRTSTGQSTLPVFVSGSNGRTSANDDQYTWIREAEKDLGSDSNVYYAASTMDLAISGDNVHLTAAGYQAALARLQRTLLYVFGSGSYYRGPSISSIRASGTGAFVNITHVGGTDISVGATHGFTASDGGGALTISSVTRHNASTVLLTFNRTISGTLVVQYCYGARPLGTAGGVFDNSTDTLPLEIETETSPTTFTPSLTINDVNAPPLAATTTATVTLSEATPSQVTVNYATANDTATAGVDYTTASGTLTFAVGETSKSIVVTI